MSLKKEKYRSHFFSYAKLEERFASEKNSGETGMGVLFFLCKQLYNTSSMRFLGKFTNVENI